jgi:Flp pilus assembly pilin Flp
LTGYLVGLEVKTSETLHNIAARLDREEGQDMIEYALLAALISIVAIAIIVLLGPYLQDLFSDVINALNSA